ncbi:glucose 1-dehydrogenase [Paenibacillus radicis (ex Xue et al. 2023)]|uniref:Glucose 1-dehydrogenase n=1 Tax=Paenibacillus radicis (ex Xue et al. 2023) TaxID=2972489 RepID=A0ABT1YCW5_9BACL|nr:glucose 1-dehydrogenase [Paenibacillus radicis (ex Xue et al. 2023)]MCR8631045.1 glucose 1-dehydrogenase [Paenibacillus radicis (ex Xue et al. 2023)]
MKTVRLRGLQAEAAAAETKAGLDSRSVDGQSDAKAVGAKSIIKTAGSGLTDHESKVRLELSEIEQPVRRQPDEVLVRVLCIGLDGTDRELMTEKYGIPPKGESELTIGHESLGVVEEAGEESGLMRGDLVCALVRRPCKIPDCVNCRNGHADFCETGQYVERGIKGSHGFLSEFYVEEARYVIKVPMECLAYGVLTEPQSIVEKVWDQAQRIQQRLIWQPKTALVLGSGPLGLLAAFTCRCLGLDTVVWSMSPAVGPAAELVRACGAEYRQAGGTGSVGTGEAAETLSGFLEQSGKRADLIFECTGYSPLAFEGMTALGANGVLALLGVTPGNRSLQISADRINQELVLENKCILGSVNASRKDFETGLYRLKLMEEKFPGLLDRLMTDRLRLEEVPDLDFKAIGIKAVVDVVPRSEWQNLINAKTNPVIYSFSV